MKKNIIIIGAGISGLSTAHKLVNKGFNVEIYEKEDIIGGMARGKLDKDEVQIEHSWRGFGPFYHNLYEIMKEIPLNGIEHFSSYTIDEISKHDSIDDLWTYYEGNVYDITDYVDEHPGGSIILNCGGKNLSDVWKEYGYEWHKKNDYVMDVLEEYKIGTIAEHFTDKNDNNNIYSNLNKDNISFYLFNNKDEKYKNPSINWKDYLFLTHIYLKVITSDKRKKKYMKRKLVDYLKNNISKQSFDYIVNFLSGPGYGLDINTLSVGHFFHFIELCLNEGSKWNDWKTLNGPIDEAWFKPWYNYLKNKGVKIYLNSELKKINYTENKINSLEIKINNNLKKISGDDYILCLGPSSLLKVLFISKLKDMGMKYLKFDTVNNQVSFRMGLKKKVNFKKNYGFILLDSPYNITFNSCSDHWKDYESFGKNGEIKTLISGTLVRTYQKGSLYNKTALNLTEKELLDEIVHQILSSKQLINFLKEENNGYILSKEDIIYKSIFEDWYERNNKMRVKNKKWINTINNEEHRIDGKTKFDNLFIGGGHIKTSTNIWLMEGAAESGLIVTNYILKKYKKKLVNVYTHKSNKLILFLKNLDNILYKFNLKNIIDILIFFILVYVIYLIVNFKS